jgi:AraC-like DNA-binding protein
VVTLNAFALDRRLARAKLLLAERCSCTETVSLLGFSSSHYFATAFYRQHGVSPGRLRVKR